MLWIDSILVMFVWCSGDFLYRKEHVTLQIWDSFVEYITYTFGLQLFSFSHAHDLQV
jgi:hypothetical protein